MARPRSRTASWTTCSTSSPRPHSAVPWWPARRFREMNTPFKLAIAAAAVVVVALVGINLLPRNARRRRPGRRQSRRRRQSPSLIAVAVGESLASTDCSRTALWRRALYVPAVRGPRGSVHGAGRLHRSGRGGRLDPCHGHRSGRLVRVRKSVSLPPSRATRHPAEPVCSSCAAAGCTPSGSSVGVRTGHPDRTDIPPARPSTSS